MRIQWYSRVVQLKKVTAILVCVLFAPVVVSAQSLEWLAEHPGSTTPAQVIPVATPVQNTNDGLEARVRLYFSDASLMAEIARCESGFRQFNSNGNPLDGGAGGMIGLFQINAGVHAKYAKSINMDIYTVDGNLAYARKLYQEEGTNPWLSSFSCWHVDSNTSGALGTLTQDLLLGTISPEVKALQIMLNNGGFKLSNEGPGSPGQETEKFGSLTRIAVRKFQCERMQLCSGDEHVNGYGMVGAKTRDVLLAMGQTTPSPVATAPNTLDNAAEIARLTNLIAQLSAQLQELKQKFAKI